MLAGVEGAVYAVGAPALRALAPTLVQSPSELSSVNLIISLGLALAVFLGPLIGGVAYGLTGAAPVVVVVAAVFALSYHRLADFQQQDPPVDARTETPAQHGRLVEALAGLRYGGVGRPDPADVARVLWLFVLGRHRRCSADCDRARRAAPVQRRRRGALRRVRSRRAACRSRHRRARARASGSYLRGGGGDVGGASRGYCARRAAGYRLDVCGLRRNRGHGGTGQPATRSCSASPRIG